MMRVMDEERNGDRIIKGNPPVIKVPPATGEMGKGKGKGGNGLFPLTGREKIL